MWTKYFGMTVDYNFGINEEPAKITMKQFPKTYFLGGYCPVHNCEVTYDRDQLDKADLVLTHMREGNLKREELPKTRPAHQRWVFMLFESPMHSPDLSWFSGFYNLTATHRESGDFPGYSAYANGMVWEKNEKFDVNFDFFSKKTREGTAIISNCGDNSGRLKYIKKLQKYMKIDVFGKCGTKCPESSENKTEGACKEILATDYKFYFSFENSLCTDYITEKFHDTLMLNIIPVVMGQGSYDLYVKFNFCSSDIFC